MSPSATTFDENDSHSGTPSSSPPYALCKGEKHLSPLARGTLRFFLRQGVQPGSNTPVPGRHFQRSRRPSGDLLG